MKSDRNIFIAFILNLSFSVFELFGGIISGSVAILSDAVHDMGDAISIGSAYFLERKSKKSPDDIYTYGYARFSVLGGVITTLILIIGSALVIFGAVQRILHPTEIDYNGMIIFAVFGTAVNFLAAFFTRHGDSLNQKAVNLHMLEDVLGWIVVLIGAVIMRFTDLAVIDPIMSIGVAAFIFINAAKTLSAALALFLEKIPEDVDIKDMREHLMRIEGVIDIHHVHIWSLDGVNNYATLHVVCNEEPRKIKDQIRDELEEHGICHATIEVEADGEECRAKHCHIEYHNSHHHHHHHC